MSSLDTIAIHNAREHNLAGVDVSIPRGRLVVVTGPSGSGKSSLAFATLHAEGQRRLVEAFNLRQRGALGALPRPAVDAVHGLTATIALEQHAGHTPARMTVGTASELHELLRVLAGRAGRLHCPECDAPIEHWTPGRIAAHIEQAPEGSRLLLIAPVLASPDTVPKLVESGFTRVRIEGQVARLDEPTTRQRVPTTGVVEVIVDRLIARPGMRARVVESVETALRLGAGELILAPADAIGGIPDARMSTRWRCAPCGLELPPLSPELFSYATASSRGVCPACSGTGVQGADESAISADDWSVDRCPECDGTRLAPVARAARFGDVRVAEFLTRPLSAWPALLASLKLPDAVAAATREGRDEMVQRIETLTALGLGHLRPRQAVQRLSTGEAQRLRLAAQIGADLSGVTYIIDEPTDGLHPDDVASVVAALVRLRDRGNTVVVVEHDPALVRFADWIIDMGPGAGADGGHVVATGTPADLRANSASVTGPWLDGRLVAPLADGRAAAAPRITLSLKQFPAFEGFRVAFPAGAITAVTGPSGVGKTALLAGALRPLAVASCDPRAPQPGFGSLATGGAFERVVWVDGTPIGRTHRSSVVTWLGIFDDIRRLYAAVPDARAAGFTASRFSFNTPGGRCEPCKGEGAVRLDMGFLSDLVIPCEACGGRRFDEATLAVRYRGLDIAELLDLTVAEARPMFQAIPTLARQLEVLVSVGLGYIRLGQPGSALSGGEAQRLRIARELARPGAGKGLFILDEPSRGLHAVDLVAIASTLRRLADAGHTVVIAEHAPQLIAACDHVVDLGPGPGEGPRGIVAEGSPTDVARVAQSGTGRHLRDLLAMPSP